MKWLEHTYLYNYLYTDCMLVISFYYLRHPDDGQRSDRNILLQDNNMWFSIFINGHSSINHMTIKHSLMYGHGTHRVHAVQHYPMSFISVYTVAVVTERKIPTTFSLFVFSSHESRGNNNQKTKSTHLPLCLFQLLTAEQTYKKYLNLTLILLMWRIG